MKKFSKYIEEMSMSVTLKPKKNNMYKVTGVGKKMAAHGGIKKGEKFHDSEIDGMHDSGIKVKYQKPKINKEAIERRADRKTIIATDPATGRKVVKVAPKKEIDIGKGKMESVEPVNELSTDTLKNYLGKAKEDKALFKGIKDKNLKKPVHKKRDAGIPRAQAQLAKRNVNEISDKTKVNYINKANKAITDKEKVHLKVGLSNVKDKSLEKRRKGVAMAKSKLGEDMTPMQMYELKISTMQKYKQAARSDVQDGENARHKGYPEKDIDKRQDKRYKGIDTANKRIAKKQVKMATGVAFDKRYKGGNMTGASKAIDKIKPGLSNHPKVKDALRRANEEFKGE
jgi:hypothetical protein